MPAHYKGFNFSPKSTVVRSPQVNTYGSKRSSGRNALSGVPNNDNGFGPHFAISFSSEQTASFKLQEFYVTIFNISDPTAVPNQPASLLLYLYSGSNVATVSIPIPAGEEMYKVDATAIPSGSFPDTFAVRIYAAFDDSSQGGVILDGIKFERLDYPGIPDDCQKEFDGIDTSCGEGDIVAPVTYGDFLLRYPTSAYEELSPWHVMATSLFAANSSEALVADGSRNILYGSTGRNKPFGTFDFVMTGRPTDSLLLDEQQSLKSNGDFEFDLISMRLGLDEIDTVANAFWFNFVMRGFDKCGNQVAQMARQYLAFPGTRGSVTEFTAGMFAESNFVGLRKVQFYATTQVFGPGYTVYMYDLPFWIDAVQYRRSGLKDSCPESA
ncbi:hypothetical protein V1525DRAFT_344564 [Lipomyces kononenkoae]|uniref:Uncharacterized protein n=1 Tax=Lipomyces kononenkoae TaxID=34357 RepID=A0ACC3SZS4_LIPKO